MGTHWVNFVRKKGLIFEIGTLFRFCEEKCRPTDLDTSNYCANSPIFSDYNYKLFPFSIKAAPPKQRFQKEL